MKVRLGLITFVVLVAVNSFAQLTEYSGGQKILAATNCSSYYAPTAAFSVDSTKFFLYVQGDINVCDPAPPHDSIYLYIKPNTWNGLTSQEMSPGETRRTLLPIPTDPLDTYYYGNPAVFTATVGGVQKYFMTTHRSPDAVDFDIILWGKSNDGITWTFSQLCQYKGTDNPNFQISGMSLRPVTIGTTNYYAGFADIKRTDGGIGIAAVRLRRNDTDPRGYDLVQFYTSSGWASTLSNGDFSFEPTLRWSAAIEPKLQSISGQWQLWVSLVGNTAQDCDSCIATDDNGWGDRFSYAQVTFGSDPNLAPTIGTHYSVLPTSPRVRCLPGNYTNSRIYPVRIEGSDLLYSASNDDELEVKGCTSSNPTVITFLRTDAITVGSSVYLRDIKKGTTLSAVNGNPIVASKTSTTITVNVNTSSEGAYTAGTGRIGNVLSPGFPGMDVVVTAVH